MVMVVVCAALWAAPGAFAAGPVVFFENLSTTVPQADLDTALPAWQIAVSRDLAPWWGTDATLTDDPQYAASANMVVRIEDEADCLGCLGYHDVIDNRPTSKVFAGTSAENGQSWQLVASHELFEMLVDPWVNSLTSWHGRMWLVEVCDPTESGFYSYMVNGVVVSDFITPAWYGSSRGRPVDFTRWLRKPGAIGKHGYASYKTDDGWGQVFGFGAPWSDPD
jgi:hypothetical protein